MLHRGQFDLELRDELVAVLALPRLLRWVVADHVAAAAFAIADDHFLDLQVVAHLVVATRSSQYVLGHLIIARDARAGARDNTPPGVRDGDIGVRCARLP